MAEANRTTTVREWPGVIAPGNCWSSHRAATKAIGPGGYYPPPLPHGRGSVCSVCGALALDRLLEMTHMNTTTLKIEDMSCQHCVRAVAEALGEVPGVRSAEVDLEHGEATV